MQFSWNRCAYETMQAYDGKSRESVPKCRYVA